MTKWKLILRALTWLASFVAVTVLGIWVTSNYQFFKGHILYLCCNVPLEISEDDLAKQAANDRDRAKAAVSEAKKELMATEGELAQRRDALNVAVTAENLAQKKFEEASMAEQSAIDSLNELRSCADASAVTDMEINEAEAIKAELVKNLATLQKSEYCARLALSRSEDGRAESLAKDFRGEGLASLQRWKDRRCADIDIIMFETEETMLNPRRRVDAIESKISEAEMSLKNIRDRLAELYKRRSCMFLRQSLSEGKVRMRLKRARAAQEVLEREVANAERTRASAERGLTGLENHKVAASEAVSTACAGLKDALDRLNEMKREPFSEDQGRQLAAYCGINTEARP